MNENENRVVHNNTVHEILLFKPRKYEWRPKEDITAYELALCLPYLLGGTLEKDESIPFHRHFIEIFV